MKTKHNVGFTLIELLVVVAIIGLLASLLLPVINRVRARADQISCLSKIRQWSLGTIMYAYEHEDVLPREDAVDDVNSWKMAMNPANEDVWYNCVAPYVKSKKVADYGVNPLDQEFYSKRSMFRCPSARFSETTVAYPVFSIVYNSQLAGLGEQATIDMIDEPSETALYVDGGVPGEKKAYATQREYNGQPKAYANRFSARHRGGGNIAMADGRARWFIASRVINPETGRSIFPPRDVIWCTRRDIKP
jgi:prepilin-type N-terminal cleavage/methylation domain-containing protein/prepilin-type processing-associated H-X9-DG protein